MDGKQHSGQRNGRLVQGWCTPGRGGGASLPPPHPSATVPTGNVEWYKQGPKWQQGGHPAFELPPSLTGLNWQPLLATGPMMPP
ncbi:hypothetical protein E2562_003657 [Oryza meyeriana var. granulata]|uniref:Uncharacterized protein n=1 Tax=Oryza meyeriana var. granulata TaxID=110450 RepID=A0A6G1C5E7_9ORYZ|nr:hypothetical protein E2562_003657 [Oryza meyeriana var. granulata]